MTWTRCNFLALFIRPFTRTRKYVPRPIFHVAGLYAQVFGKSEQYTGANYEEEYKYWLEQQKSKAKKKKQKK